MLPALREFLTSLGPNLEDIDLEDLSYHPPVAVFVERANSLRRIRIRYTECFPGRFGGRCERLVLSSTYLKELCVGCPELSELCIDVHRDGDWVRGVVLLRLKSTQTLLTL